MDIFVQKDGQQQGPHSIDHLREGMISGEFQADDWVWSEGQTEWTPLHDFLEKAVVPANEVHGLPPQVLRSATRPAAKLNQTLRFSIGSVFLCGFAMILMLTNHAILFFLCTCVGVSFGHYVRWCTRSLLGEVLIRRLSLVGLLSGHASVWIYAASVVLAHPTLGTPFQHAFVSNAAEANLADPRQTSETEKISNLKTIESFFRVKHFQIPMVGMPIRGDVVLSGERSSTDVRDISLVIIAYGKEQKVESIAISWMAMNSKTADGEATGKSLSEWRKTVCELVGDESGAVDNWVIDSTKQCIHAINGKEVNFSTKISGIQYKFSGSMDAASITVDIILGTEHP